MPKLDVYAQIWPTTPKVHKSVVKAVMAHLAPDATFSTIYTLVEISGIREQDDVLATARYIRDQIRNNH